MRKMDHEKILQAWKDKPEEEKRWASEEIKNVKLKWKKKKRNAFVEKRNQGLAKCYAKEDDI